MELMMVVFVARLVSGKWDSHPKTTDLNDSKNHFFVPANIPSNYSRRMVLLESYIDIINLQKRSIIPNSHRDPMFVLMELE
jgi:hypothetical protein